MVDEMEGDGNAYDFGARIFSPRLGRWFSCDALEAKYPGISPYNFSLNNPIIFNDQDGNDARYTVVKNEKGGGNITIESTIHLYGKDASKDLAKNINSSFSDLNNMATYTDPKTKENWDVVININFVYDENVKSKKDILKIPHGDNIFLVDESLALVAEDKNVGEIQGSSCIGCQFAESNMSDYRVILHEVGHEIGFDERYNKYQKLASLVGDIMGAIGPYNLKISPIHFEDIAKTILKKTNNGESNLNGVNSDRLDNENYDPLKLNITNVKNSGTSDNISDLRKQEQK
jgi:RHS repeat-associated protein